MRRVILALACTACGPAAYVCTDHDECMNAALAGMCQPDGHCSFPDDDCPSGQRYGEHGGAMSGQCVAEVADTGTDTSTTASSSASTSTSVGTTTTDPVTSTTTPVTLSSSSITETDPTTSTPTESSSTEGTTDVPVPPPPLLWFTFDALDRDGIANLGSLGGSAVCTGEACPAIVEGIVGSAARFDGVDDCAVFSHVPELGPLTQLSIAAWILRDMADADYDCILCKPVGALPWNSWRLATYDDEMAGSVIDFRVGLADDSGVSIAGSSSIGTWVHAVGVWDGNGMVLWIDGEIAMEAKNPLYEFDEQPVYLGCDDDHEMIGITNFLTAAVDEVRFYDRALGEDEIAALYAEGGM